MSRIGKVCLFFAGISLLSFIIVRLLLGVWVPFLWLCLGMFVGFLLGAIWVDRKLYKEFFSMKTTRQGMSMGTMILLVLVLLVAVNFIAARKYKTFDFSMAKINSLSAQSIQMLKSLKSDLKVLYFYKEGAEGVEQNRQAFMELIKKYQDQSDWVKLEFVEVNERPDLAQQYDVKQGVQVVYLDYNSHKSKIEKIDEQELTSGIVKVTRETSKTVYVLSGHGEPGFEESPDGQSLSFLKTLLEGNRYNVKTLALTQLTAVPSDADIVMVVGPKQALLETELKALENYLARGGSMIFALEGTVEVGLDELLAKMKMRLQKNYVVPVMDTQLGKVVDPRMGTAGNIFSMSSPITQPFGKNEFTVFRWPSSLEKLDTTGSSIKLDEIVKTGVGVWGFSDLKFQKQTGTGPFILGLSATGKINSAAEKEFSAVVLSDSDIMNNQFLYKNLNRDLVLNSIAFLSKEENLISITPKEVQRTELLLTETHMILFIFGFVIPLPVLLFAASGVMWFRRRNA